MTFDMGKLGFEYLLCYLGFPKLPNVCKMGIMLTLQGYHVIESVKGT